MKSPQPSVNSQTSIPCAVFDTPSWVKPECHRALRASCLTGQILKLGEINRPLATTTNPISHLFDEESPACAKARCRVCLLCII